MSDYKGATKWWMMKPFYILIGVVITESMRNLKFIEPYPQNNKSILLYKGLKINLKTLNADYKNNKIKYLFFKSWKLYTRRHAR